MIRFTLFSLVLSLVLPLSPAFAQDEEAENAPAMPSKLVIAFQKQKDPREIQKTADELATRLSSDLGLPVEIHIPTSYGASVQALVSNHAQVAYLSSVPFVLARSEAPVELLLAEVRAERTDYDSILVVRKDSPYQSLEDLRGARMMFTSQTSTSGYVMAYSMMVNEGVIEKGQSPGEFFRSINFAGGYDRALLAVLNKQADVCAVSDYTMIGPNADLYLTAEQRDQLRILRRTPGVPTHLICVRKDLPRELRDKLRASLLAISKEKPKLLADVYGAAEFAVVDEETHLRATIQAMENTGIGARALVQ